MQTLLIATCPGQSLSDLYIQWDIAKTGTSSDANLKGQKANKNSPNRIFGRVVGMVEQLPGIFLQLQPEMRAQLVTQLEKLLKQLQATPASTNN